jgi:hypothetical protein
VATRFRFAIHSEDRKLVIIFFLLWVVVLLMSSLFFLYGPPFFPVWYSRTVEAEQLAPKVFIWVFPSVATVILVLSLLFGRKTDLEQERYLAKLSLWSGLILFAFLLIAQLRILKIIL